jgi:hypothetical protein
MDIKDTRQLLSRIREDVELARRIIEKETSDARMLIDQEVQREFADVLLEIGDDIATAEVKWRYFGKVGFGQNKMCVIKK